MPRTSCLLILAALVAGCSGATGGSRCSTSDDCPSGQFCIADACEAADGRTVSVVVSTSGGNSVLIGTNQQFTAQVSGVDEQGVTWSIEAAGGIIGPGGIFSAQHSGTWHVVAQSEADRSQQGSLEIVVPAVQVSLSPASASLLIGATQQFTATVRNAPDTTVHWDVLEPAGGTVTAGGLYTPPAAPQTPATFHVRATSAADPTQSATAAVSFHDLNVAVSPSAATLQVGQQQAFTIPGQQPVRWSIQEDNAGTISDDGVYFAPSSATTPAVFHVVATSTEDTSHFAIAEVTLAEISVTASPNAVGVRFAASVQLSGTETNAPGDSVFWILERPDSSNGTITGSGLYTAPGGSGVLTVQALAVSGADPTKTSPVEITVDLRPAIESFAANQLTASPGAAVTLGWTVGGDGTLSISPGVGDVTGKRSVQVNPSATTAYTLTATNGEGTATAATTVQVVPGVPAISSFAASGGRLLPGQKSTLSWNVHGADTIDLEPGVGLVPAQSSIEVAPGAETQYLLTATNAQGAAVAVTTVRLARFRQTGPLIDARQVGWTTSDDEFSWWTSQAQNLVPLPDGTSLLIGGMAWRFADDIDAELLGPFPVPTAEIFDPKANGGEGGFIASIPFSGDEPQQAPPFQDQTDQIGVVRLPSGKVLVADHGMQQFNPATRAFENLGANPAGVDVSGLLLPDGRVALLGAAGAFVYDPVSMQATEYTGTGCSYDDAATPVLLPSGKILVSAAFCGQALWDPATPAGQLAFTIDQAGIPVSGSIDNFTLPDGKVLLFSALYDPATDTVVNANVIGFGAFFAVAPAVQLPNGWVLFLGVDFESHSATLFYDPVADVVRPGPKPLFEHAGGYVGVLADGSILLAGGTGFDNEQLTATRNAEILEWQ